MANYTLGGMQRWALLFLFVQIYRVLPDAALPTIFWPECVDSVNKWPTWTVHIWPRLRGGLLAIPAPDLLSCSGAAHVLQLIWFTMTHSQFMRECCVCKHLDAYVGSIFGMFARSIGDNVDRSASKQNR